MRCQALRLQRARLNLSAHERAMVLTDGFTGNTATKHGEDTRRARWSQSVNCGFFPPPPGGWSAHGQPCDAVHSHYRRLMDCYEDICLGFEANPLKRARIEFLLRDEVGFVPRNISHESVVECAVWAWEARRLLCKALCVGRVCWCCCKAVADSICHVWAPNRRPCHRL